MKINLEKEKVSILLAVVATAIIALWVFQKPDVDQSSKVSSGESDEREWATVIPKGYLVVPLVLENKRALAPLIRKWGVIDVFSKVQNKRLAKNLRILKLSPSDEEVEFGALVPDAKARELQTLLRERALLGAIKSQTDEAVEFNISPTRSQTLDKIETQEGTI